MSVKKAFVFSLIIFILMNFMFTIIYFSIQGRLNYFFYSITEKPFRILFYLFQPIFIFPWDSINALFLFSEPATIAMLCGFILAPLIASIGAGTYGEDGLQSFGGWCLTIFPCSTIWIVLLSYDPIFKYYIDFIIPLEQAIITLIMNGIVLCLIYGSCASFFSYIKKRTLEDE